MTELIGEFAAQFGLLPLYAVIAAFQGYRARDIQHLIFGLGILCGVYVALFKALNLKMQLGVIDVTSYLPVSQDIGNIIVAALFVYIIGFAAYGVKRMLPLQTAE